MTEAGRYLQKASREGAANLVASASVTRCPAFGFILIGGRVLALRECRYARNNKRKKWKTKVQPRPKRRERRVGNAERCWMSALWCESPTDEDNGENTV